MGLREGSTILVLAGNVWQANEWAHTKGLTPNEWEYFGESNLAGFHFNRYAVVGTFWERKNADEIYDYARIRLDCNAEQVC